jgi:hypothetical protein
MMLNYLSHHVRPQDVEITELAESIARVYNAEASARKWVGRPRDLSGAGHGAVLRCFETLADSDR